MNNLDYLKIVRLAELDAVLPSLVAKFENMHDRQPYLLEIGAGVGFQARQLINHGFKVEAIDLEEANESSETVFNIIKYDGQRIPFDNETFDIVFSSNVLEHIPHLIEFQEEIQRVLKKDGIAFHVVPSTSWRLITNFQHYSYLVKALFLRLRQKLVNPSPTALSIFTGPKKHYHLYDIILPSRHGEKGNCITEMYYFSRYYWSRLFLRTGWVVDTHTTNRITYSGYCVFGSTLPILFRKKFSYIFGSACHVFILLKLHRFK